MSSTLQGSQLAEPTRSAARRHPASAIHQPDVDPRSYAHWGYYANSSVCFIDLDTMKQTQTINSDDEDDDDDDDDEDDDEDDDNNN